MDAFYASVEQRDDPGLRGRPVIVGAPPTQRGVVCASSYEARKFGVRSAMPSATAGRLCPNGIFVRPRMDHYREESQHIMQIVAQTGAVVETMSIDEAYLDVSLISQAESADASFLKAVPLARHVKQRILSERKLTATIGIASNKLLAKIASDHKKPDGLTIISDREKVSFLRPLPVRVICGVGKVTELTLGQAGIATVPKQFSKKGSESTFQRIFHWPQPCPTKRPPQNSPGKDRLLGVGCWFRRELVRTFAAVCCERALTGQVSCFCALRVRAAPSRLIAPSRPPINCLYIPRRHCLRLLCLGRSLFGLKQGMLLFQFLPSK
jgi:hypothetical protein